MDRFTITKYTSFGLFIWFYLEAGVCLTNGDYNSVLFCMLKVFMVCICYGIYSK